jgi:hypothetical protein
MEPSSSNSDDNHQVWVSILPVSRALSGSRDGGLKKRTKPRERRRRDDDHANVGAVLATHGNNTLARPEGGCVM